MLDCYSTRRFGFRQELIELSPPEWLAGLSVYGSIPGRCGGIYFPLAAPALAGHILALSNERLG
jgi:hypothetical protein